MTKYRGEDFLRDCGGPAVDGHRLGLARQIVEDISYNNANRYFGFEV